MVFANSSYQKSRMHCIWYGAKIPPKRKQFLRGGQQPSAPESTALSTAKCCEILAGIEKVYTETMGSQDKEWDEPAKRQQWKSSLDSVNSEAALSQLLV